jgi:outer membrane protein assembly factor BamB/predicted phosphohydrolase
LGDGFFAVGVGLPFITFAPVMKKLFLVLVIGLFELQLAAQSCFKFAHVSDTHVGGAPTAIDDLRSTVRDINGDPSLKFVIITGDITEFGADDELSLAKQVLDSLNKPWYIIPGNHDANWSESGANTFKRVFGAETSTFEYGGYLFVGTACGPNMRMGPGQVPREDIVWLDSLLGHMSKPGMPVVYFNHYPQDSSQNNWYEVMDRLKQKNIQLILCGHGHANVALNFEGVPGIMGRSNLRARDSIGGYNIVTFSHDTVTCQTRRPGQPAGPVWTQAVLYDHHFKSDTTHYYRPSFEANTEYPNVRQQWQYQAQSDIGTGNVLMGDLVIGTDTDGWLFALDAASGEKRWAYRTGGKIYSTPAVSGNIVVVGSTDRYIYGIRGGQVVWKVETKKPVVASPLVSGGVVYIGGGDGCFRALDAATGKLRWEFDSVRSFVVDRPLEYQGRIYFGCWGNDFYCLNKTTGKLLWKWNNGSTNRMFSPAACYPVATNGRVFIVAPDNFMTALDAATGKVFWRQRAPELRVRESMGLSEDSSMVYVKTMEGVLIGVSTAAYELQIDWQSPLQLGYELSPTPLVESNGFIYIPTHSGTVWVVDRAEGRLIWKHKTSNCMVNGILPLGGSGLLVSTMDGKLTCLKVGR